MRQFKFIGKSMLALTVVAAATLGICSANAQIIRPPVRCICPDVYAPVTCSNGVTYSNACRASCAGATGCVPGWPSI